MEEHMHFEEEEEMEEEEFFEWDTHKGKGKKAATSKLRANHLLNFKYAQAPKPTVQRRRRAQGSVVPFEKGRFLQANCSFVVLKDGDYLANLRDPDLLVDWHSVEQVILTTCLSYTCPICLDEFTAAKVAKCGHVFCWHCIIRHLSYSPTNSLLGKCPICFEMVYLKELKSMLYRTATHYVEGAGIKFTLLKRSKGSIVPLPKKTWTPSRELHLSSEDSNMFAKFILTSDISNILAREEQELEVATREAASTEDDSLPFLLLAMEQLQERKKKFFNQHAESIQHKELKDTSPVSELPIGEHRGEAEESTVPVETEKLESSIPPIGKEEKKCEQEKASKGKRNGHQREESHEDDLFYTYQSSDGQQLFLCPLNLKMLLHEYGTYENLPDIIEGKILEIEDFTLTEALRKRYKSLSHLPLSSNFQFLEVDLKPRLSKSTQKAFKDEVFRRARKRKELKRKSEEEKRNEGTIFSFYKDSDLLSEKNFPSYGGEKEEVPTGPDESKMGPTEGNSSTTTTTTTEEQVIPEKSATVWGKPSPPSFADALKSQKKEPILTADMQKKKSKNGVQYVILSSGGRGRRRS